MAKQVRYKASVLKDTNRVVSTSHADWQNIRENSDLRFFDDSFFYSVSFTQPLFFVESFELGDSPNELRIEEDIGIDLLEEDEINVSFKEYQIRTISNIYNPGKRYNEGDVLEIQGGTPSLDLYSGVNQHALLRVSEINHKGEIEQLTIDKPGKYIQKPPKKAKLLKGNGQNATVELEFKLIPHRSTRERVINRIHHDPERTYIYLDAALPQGVQEGKISCSKWELFLTSNYVGSDKIGENCEIIRDFHPNYKLPKIVKNSKNPEVQINHIVGFFDRKIKDLENQNNNLEKELKDLRHKLGDS